ncbi:MAG TPA: hypothetical protein VGK82_11500, partial [Pyrinomonadaceae bacterium]
MSLPRIAPVAMFLCLAAVPVLAQTPPAKSAAPKPGAAAADAEQQLRTRRAQARSLLIALS